MDLVIMIMRACIYPLFPLYLGKLLFTWLLMKMLLTICLKISHNVIEVTVVLMVLLLALKLVQSGVRHTRGGGHDIVCTSLSLLRRERGGVEPPTIYLKGQGGVLDGTSHFRGVCWERGDDIFRSGCNFYLKNKLKSEILNDKKNYKQKYFSLS